MNLKLNYLFVCLHSLWCADIIVKSTKRKEDGYEKADRGRCHAGVYGSVLRRRHGRLKNLAKGAAYAQILERALRNTLKALLLYIGF